MRLSNGALFLVVFTFLSIGHAFATALDSRISAADTHFNGGGAERSLRGAGADDTEDRAISEFVSKFFTGLQKSRAEREMTRQIRSWVVAEKSDDFILDALKLNGLTQAELKDHPSYKLFGDVKVENWLKESTSLNTVWSNLGLTDLSREEVKATAALHIFLKYVIKYDAKAKKSISGITNKKLQQAAKPVVDPEELYWVKQILTANDRDFLYIEWLVRGMPV